MKRAHHDIICSTLIAVDAVQVESRGRTPAELEGLLLLPPQPQLRNLFPGPALPNPVCEAPGSGVFSRNSNQRASFTGGMGGSMPMGGAGGPAAAKAWAKLMLVHERQQREQRWGTQQQADSDSISTSL